MVRIKLNDVQEKVEEQCCHDGTDLELKYIQFQNEKLEANKIDISQLFTFDPSILEHINKRASYILCVLRYKRWTMEFLLHEKHYGIQLVLKL